MRKALERNIADLRSARYVGVGGKMYLRIETTCADLKALGQGIKEAGVPCQFVASSLNREGVYTYSFEVL